jgi:ATPase family AAA domain-containing protein 2
LHGPPGTGKTLLARCLSEYAKPLPSLQLPVISFFAHSGADILNRFFGESELRLRQIFAKAQASAPSIIFFDEIDALAPVRSAKQNQVCLFPL